MNGLHKFDMFVPNDLPDLLEYLDSHQTEVLLIANGSDLINRIQRRELTPKVVADLSGLSELNYVKRDKTTIKIGALTTVADLALSPVLDSRYAVFREVAAKFGGPSIRNVATVGGNICAASSSEDLLPVLLVLDAKVHLKSRLGERTLRLDEFLRGKRKTDLKANEILVETTFRELDDDSSCAFEKIGMRNSLIIAFVSSAVYLQLDRKTKLVDEVRIAFNRVAGKIPERATMTEQVLRGKTLSRQLVEETASTLFKELRLSSDFRTTREYRSEVACVLFKRALERCYEKWGGRKLV
jgi:carbon-monoxide dehydrogenase medium subunit